MYDGSLEILNATKKDQGLYTCFAENDRGKANSSGYLKITGQANKVCFWGRSYDSQSVKKFLNFLSLNFICDFS